MVSRDQMLEIDRWALARYASVSAKIVQAYEDYDYPAVYQSANAFITVDLSAFYVDVTKDRMYTFGAGSRARRSGQTAMYLIVDGLARLMAPILPFTMDELWRNLPGPREPSVHLAVFNTQFESWRDDLLLERWAQLAAIRDQVNGALEERRQDKTIKSNLSAQVRVAASGELGQLLASYADELPTLFGVSEAALDAAPDDALRVTVSKADGVKCDRCWRYVPSVAEHGEFTGLCERCIEALAETVNR
jgi:isoleucyl-tRNA synthetase